MTIPAPDSAQQTPDMQPHLFRWYWQEFLGRYWPLLLIAIILMAIEGATLASFAVMMQPMFDSIFEGGSRAALWGIGLAMLAIFTLRAFASLGQKILVTRVNELVGARLRARLLSHLMTLDGSFHQQHPPGQLIERVQGDVNGITSITAMILISLGRDLAAVLALFAVALVTDWQWTLIALVGIPLLVAPSLVVQRLVRRLTRKSREVEGTLSTRLDEVFHGINPVKLNNLEDYQSRRYRDLLGQKVRLATSSAAGKAAIPSLVDIMTGLGFMGVMVLGGGEILSGEKTMGQFMTFFTAMASVFGPLRRLAGLSGSWQAGQVALERLKSVLDIAASITPTDRPQPIPQAPPEIRLQDVRLDYGATEVLHGVTFTAAAGKTTALVGASGAGKSSVFNLLPRLIDPSSGAVLINGISNKDFALHDLRDLFSVVSQDSALFDESLRDNILLDRPAPEDSMLEDVLAAAHVTDFLKALPEGLDSPVGPRGSALSGGQRQRVAIARALLRDTPVLLLDEATSALDTRSEVLVQQALEQLSHGRTTLVIAHRLSTIRNADSIVVMDAGRVVDQGTHDELLARGGIYADLYAMQFRSSAESETDE
ncbi:ABC transporter ATP-binding protein [Ketogulonicigenium vulgare]|uniref:ABC transporter ATP-binding protein n=1 Tax=Ketogulonicigenium vulgare TaxID=92945 RepID=UPI0023595C5F|nr:ABC transporter transmembrane domain-containing protein [Ketogulonicigenium vulgare]